MDHDYRIEGHVNSRAVLGTGTGNTDPRTGVSEMEVTFQVLPDGWDPRTIVLMCCDRAPVMASREVDDAVGMFRASGGYLTIGRDLVRNDRESVMRDANGLIMAHVRASSITDFRADLPYDHSRIEGGVSHLRPGVNGIANVKPITGVMMQAGPGLIVVTTSFEVALEDGKTLYGSTNYPHYLPDQKVTLDGIQVIYVSSIQQEFDGRKLWLRTESQVSRLYPARAEASPAEAFAKADVVG